MKKSFLKIWPYIIAIVIVSMVGLLTSCDQRTDSERLHEYVDKQKTENPKAIYTPTGRAWYEIVEIEGHKYIFARATSGRELTFHHAESCSCLTSNK